VTGWNGFDLLIMLSTLVALVALWVFVLRDDRR
jgi:hypothetical protein